MSINKAVIPAAGLGTRFLPLSKVVPKELLPLVDKPMIDYAIEEAISSGIEKITLVTSDNKDVAKYFEEDERLGKILKENNRDKNLINGLKEHRDKYEGVSFSEVSQKFPKGDGDAILKAKKKIGNDPFAVLFPDDVFDYKTSPTEELAKMFRTSEKPVIGLKRVAKDRVSSYGTVAVEKIANKFYKIKEIKEKVSEKEAPSDLVISGRYILTPEVFNYLKKTEENNKGEIILADALNNMAKDGKVIYGAEIKGDWLECGKTEDWLKSFMYLAINHPDYGPMLKEYIKNNT